MMAAMGIAGGGYVAHQNADVIDVPDVGAADILAEPASAVAEEGANWFSQAFSMLFDFS